MHDREAINYHSRVKLGKPSQPPQVGMEKSMCMEEERIMPSLVATTSDLTRTTFAPKVLQIFMSM